MHTNTETLTAPVPVVEPVRFTFTTLVPAEIAHDPDACERFWHTSALVHAYTPVGRPEVLHEERRRVIIAYKSVWVCDDGSPVECVTGEVIDTPTCPQR